MMSMSVKLHLSLPEPLYPYMKSVSMSAKTLYKVFGVSDYVYLFSATSIRKFSFSKQQLNLQGLCDKHSGRPQARELGTAKTLQPTHNAG